METITFIYGYKVESIFSPFSHQHWWQKSCYLSFLLNRLSSSSGRIHQFNKADLWLATRSCAVLMIFQAARNQNKIIECQTSVITNQPNWCTFISLFYRPHYSLRNIFITLFLLLFPPKVLYEFPSWRHFCYFFKCSLVKYVSINET